MGRKRRLVDRLIASVREGREGLAANGTASGEEVCIGVKVPQQDEGGGEEDHDRHREERSAIVLHHDPKLGEMEEDGPAHRTDSEERADRCEASCREQNENRCDQFDDPAPDAAEGLKTQGLEDVARLRCAREFEEESLEQDAGGGEAGGPFGEFEWCSLSHAHERARGQFYARECAKSVLGAE